MASESENDLMIKVGLTEKQYLQALARMEASTVKAANRNQKSFSRSNKSIERGFRQVSSSAGKSSFAMRNVSMQLSQVAQQGAVTGDYMRALAIQLPDLALGFGAVGIAIGALAPIALSLVQGLMDTKGNADLAKEALEGMGDADLGSIRSAISDLKGIQEAYTKAIADAGNASGSAASLVIANSEKEFNARKKVLEIEVELLNIRAEENREAIRNIRDQQKAVLGGINRDLDVALNAGRQDFSRRPDLDAFGVSDQNFNDAASKKSGLFGIFGEPRIEI